MKNSSIDKQKFRFGLTSIVKRFHFLNIVDNSNEKTFSSSFSIFLTSIFPVRRLHKLSPAFIIFEQPKMSIKQASSVRENGHYGIY
jgi:hypothetical protein